MPTPTHFIPIPQLNHIIVKSRPSPSGDWSEVKAHATFETNGSTFDASFQNKGKGGPHLGMTWQCVGQDYTKSWDSNNNPWPEGCVVSLTDQDNNSFECSGIRGCQRSDDTP